MKENPRLVTFSSFVEPLLCCTNVQLLVHWFIHSSDNFALNQSYFALIDVLVLSKPSDGGRHFVWRAFATFLSINLISALNFNFLHCLGLIDALSANELAEMFACVFCTENFIAPYSALPLYYIWSVKLDLSSICHFWLREKVCQHPVLEGV